VSVVARARETGEKAAVEAGYGPPPQGHLVLAAMARPSPPTPLPDAGEGVHYMAEGGPRWPASRGGRPCARALSSCNQRAWSDGAG